MTILPALNETNSSVVVCYYTGEKGRTDYTYKKAVEAEMDITNLYTELSGYFVNKSEHKQFLQLYRTMTSIRFGREGIMVHGVDDEPFTISFEQIESIKNAHACLYFTLKNGVMIRASLVSDDCRIKLPNDNLSLWEVMNSHIYSIYEKMFGNK